MADACNANPHEFVQYILSETIQAADQAANDSCSILTEHLQIVALSYMQDSCDLDPVAKEICTSWSLFVPVAQKYMQSTSVSHVGLFILDDS